MLTGFQAEVIAFGTDGGFVCAKHIESEFAAEIEDNENYWDAIADLEELSGQQAYSRYSLDEAFPEGLNCDDCGDELVEPADDYCTAHDSWRITDSGDKCESADGAEWADDEHDPCSFPADTDPNPAVARWVPCGTCGAGDGEPHDLTKHAS